MIIFTKLMQSRKGGRFDNDSFEFGIEIELPEASVNLPSKKAVV